MTGDNSDWNDASRVIEELWAIRRGNSKDRLSEVISLLDHPDPNVREEAISLLFVKWQMRNLRTRLEDLIADRDFGVRAVAIGALASLSNDTTHDRDIAILRSVVLDQSANEIDRKAAYEGLRSIARGEVSMLADDVDVDEDLDLTWVREL